LGIKNVTAFLFSIDNFQRPKEEVDYLMDLAVENFEKLREMAEAKDWCIHICGDISMFPERVSNLQNRLKADTCQNKG
jgi:undecaprenyl diphosphate synthase